MDNQDNEEKIEITPEERTAEEEAIKEVNEDELREKVAEEFGIDPDENPELFEKLVEKHKEFRQKLSGAIKQKIKYRNLTKGTSEKPKASPEVGKSQIREEVNIDEIVDRKLNERLEQRELEALNLPEELKAEVKDLAKLKGISVREAAQHSYIKTMREEFEREERIKNATPKRSNKGSFVPKYDPSKPLNINDFKTSDGKLDVEGWREARAARARYKAQK